MFSALLLSLSFFVTDVFSLEIELQKESERIQESMGWITPEKLSYQEQMQVIIDQDNLKNRISISMVSANPNDIRFPEYIEAIRTNEKVVSFTLTNQFACEPTRTELACVIIEVDREGLGGDVVTIRENTRKITDEIVDQGIILFAPEFSSVTVKSKMSFDGKKISVAQAMYTINKQPTDRLFLALSNLLISSDIRTAGGFYDHAEKLSKNPFSDFSITLVPINNTLLRGVHVSLTCSDDSTAFTKCQELVNEQIERGEISPLDFIQTENLTRSKIFGDGFLPLNSIVQVLIFSEQDLQVTSVNTNVIENLQHLGDIQENGWFFSSQSGNMIDGRYLFGIESSVNKNDLAISIGDNTGSDIKMNEGGGCLIATAAFGSEIAPQVQFLREIRDNTVLQTESGTSFMTGFNQFYYSFSPVVADYERENPAFKEAVKITLTPLLTSLALLNYVDIDSEHEMLGYGIGVILLNIGMYFVAPAILIIKIKKLI